MNQIKILRNLGNKWATLLCCSLAFPLFSMLPSKTLHPPIAIWHSNCCDVARGSREREDSSVTTEWYKSCEASFPIDVISEGARMSSANLSDCTLASRFHPNTSLWDPNSFAITQFICCINWSPYHICVLQGRDILRQIAMLIFRTYFACCSQGRYYPTCKKNVGLH